MTIWNQAKIGGGGFMTDIVIASDGTAVAGTDTIGAYGCNTSTYLWQQLVTVASMPPGDPNVGIGTGEAAFAITIAPSNTQRFVMMFKGCVYYTDNRGTNWTKSSTWTPVSLDPNSVPTKLFGPKIAIDPQNANIWYVSTPGNGCFVTFDAGASWAVISTVGTGTVPPGGASQKAGHLICFDPTSSVSASKKQGIFISTNGTGVYHSIDGGTSWTLLNTTGMPTTHVKMLCDPAGILWHIANDGGGDHVGSLNKWVANTWTQPLPNSAGCTGIAVNPANGANIICVNGPGSIIVSTNTGGAWTAFFAGTRVAGDVPWLANTNESNFTAGNIAFDPFRSNKLLIAEGIGMWEATPPTTATAFNWTSKSAGIESMVSNWCVSPPGGAPIFSFWDRPFFTYNSPSTYPSNHGVNYTNVIQAGWHVDYAAGTPSTVVGLATGSNGLTGEPQSSGVSTDGGATWSTIPMPSDIGSAGYEGGSIAALSATNFILAESNGGKAYYTTNSGATWTQVSISGVTSQGWGGSNFYLGRHIVCADRVTADTAYLYIANDGSSADGVFRTIDKGVTWTRRSTPAFNGPTGFASHLNAVPGNAGHLFFTAGYSAGASHPDTGHFYYSTNGGTSFSALANILEVFAFGFGAIRSGSDYPSVYFYGWLSGVLGIYRSDSNAAAWAAGTQTWTQISDGYPTGNFSTVKTISGDANTWGTVYVGTTSSSFFVGSELTRVGGLRFGFHS